MRSTRTAILAALALPVGLSSPTAASGGAGNVPQGTQSDSAYARSFQRAGVTNVFATAQRVSCYRPEVPYFTSDGPANGYTGMTACPGATTGENTGAAGPYASQLGSNAGYPA